MPVDPKSHARAVVLATTMNSVVPAPSIAELQIRVPAVYAIARYAPPLDLDALSAGLRAAASDSPAPRPLQRDRCEASSRHFARRRSAGRWISGSTPSRPR